MELTFIYQKERNKFGRQCLFSDKNELMFSEPSNRAYFNNYILKNPISEGTQYTKQLCLNEINTERSEYKNIGNKHNEGGWPKEINVDDVEQTDRYKRKVMKSEGYIAQVNKLIEPMERYIYENNAVNIYEDYFQNDDIKSTISVKMPTSKIISVYRDTNLFTRPVTSLSWSPHFTKLAIAHSHPDQNNINIESTSTESFIWEIENPNIPLIKLIPKSSIVCLEYNQRDSNCIASGLTSGQVAVWDTRISKDPVSISEREISHREIVNSLLWISSKTGTEFFSGSSDGDVIWWDIRKLNERLNHLLMDPVKTDEQILRRSYGVTVLEYETTIPTKFMCATQQGYVFSCNRKGKVPTEKINAKMLCHFGPIYTLARNHSFLKNFLTIGDFCAKIWSEDCKDSSIFCTKNHTEMLTNGAWSFTKASMFFTTRLDGILDVWDLMQQLDEPILSVKVCDEAILTIKPHSNGKHIALGCMNGSTYLVELSESMIEFDKHEKTFLTAFFERETHREKILETKLREAKLKLKTAKLPGDDDIESSNEDESLAICKKIDEQYFNDVKKENLRRHPELNVKADTKRTTSCCKAAHDDDN